MKNKIKPNYLEKIPSVKQDVTWNVDDKYIVTVRIENKGIANRLAQILLKKPRFSYIKLDEFGSFVWSQIDGKKDIVVIGELVRKQFGEKAEPLYERLSQYFKTLENCKFITLN